MSEATEEPEEENPFATGHKQELRRQRRKAREAEWRAFNATKPDEQYENPDDVAAIEVARNTLGDFKLKSAPDYVVPEEDSMNYRRKREQMLLLEEAIHDAKVDFNAEFAALRDVRARSWNRSRQSARASRRLPSNSTTPIDPRASRRSPPSPNPSARPH